MLLLLAQKKNPKKAVANKLPIGDWGISIKLGYYCGAEHWYFIPSTY
jgi:hypothetical protein